MISGLPFLFRNNFTSRQPQYRPLSGPTAQAAPRFPDRRIGPVKDTPRLSLSAVLFDVDFTLARPGPELGPEGAAE